MIIKRIKKPGVCSTDRLRPQFLYSEIRSRMASIGMNVPKHNVTISFANRAEFDRLLRRDSGRVTGLTVSSGSCYGMRHHIYMLDEMPVSNYKETLAHECGHVWLNDRHSILNRHSSQEIEGFCNLVAYKVLLFDHSQEAEQTRRGMLLNPDPIYGEGFRMMKQRAEQMGWNRMLANYS